jgi:hypothetical protein
MAIIKEPPEIDITTHNGLMIDLAKHFNTPYYEMPLGSIWGAMYSKDRLLVEAAMTGSNEEYDKALNTVIGIPRADVVTVRPSYVNFQVNIYEVKVSRADFLQDSKSKKWQKYIPHCHKIYFAAPKGLLSKSEIPIGCGLIVRNNKSWHVVKRAVDNGTVDIPYETMMSMLFKRHLMFARWLGENNV